MNNLVLVGFKHSGKTTWGKELAQMLGWSFLDTDHEISGNCSSFYKSQGASSFREREKEVIRSLLSLKQTVVASGGGSILDPENLVIFKKIGKIIYLFVPKEELKRRFFALPLPAFFDPKDPLSSFESIYKERAFLYERGADFTVSSKEELWQLAIPLGHSFASPLGENPMEKPSALLSMDVPQG